MRKKFKDKLYWTASDVNKTDQHFSIALTGYTNSSFNDSAIIVVDSFGNGFDCYRYAIEITE